MSGNPASATPASGAAAALSNAAATATNSSGNNAAQTTNKPTKPVQVKLVLLGEAAVGKSSVVLRFVQNDFQENKEPTIGAAFLTQKCRLDDTVIKFEIWDTAGQERFHSLAPMYYRNAAAAVVVYDITSAASLEKAKSWVKELQRQANSRTVIAFVGNKLDLVQDNQDDESSDVSSGAEDEEDDDDENDDDATATGAEQSSRKKTKNASERNSAANARQVTTEEAKAYADENGLLFFETSAKTGENVVDVFTEIAGKIPIDEYRHGGRGAGAGTRGRGAGATSGQGDDNQVNLNQSGAQQNATGCNC